MRLATNQWSMKSTNNQEVSQHYEDASPFEMVGHESILLMGCDLK